MPETYYQLSRLKRIHRLRRAAQQLLQQYDINWQKLSFIPSSLPAFRVAASSQHYLLKFSRGFNPDVGEKVPYFNPPGTNTHLQLLWMEALAQDTDLVLQRPIRNNAGDLITSAQIDDLPGSVDGFVCTWLSGRAIHKTWRPRPWPGPKIIRQMGRIAATFHTHAQHWPLPSAYERPRTGWRPHLTHTFETLSKSPHIQSVPRADIKTLDRALKDIYAILDSLGTDPMHFGLIHEDICMHNCIVHKDGLSPIDFGNTIFGYYLWDMVHAFGTPDFNSPAFYPRHRAYIDGYREIRRLPDDYVRIILALFVVHGIVETAYTLDSAGAAEWIPKVRIPRAVWMASRFLKGEKFLAI